MSYQAPTDSRDRLAHILSEVMNDDAPIGWESYRGYAECLLGPFCRSEIQTIFDEQSKAEEVRS